jgi:hypothetical protein
MSFLSSSSPSCEGPHTLQTHLNKRNLLTKTGLFDIPHDSYFVGVQGVKEALKRIYREINFWKQRWNNEGRVLLLYDKVIQK